MKTEKQLLDAHDLLEDVLGREVDGASDVELSGRAKMGIVLMTLCWVLEHSNGKEIEDRLRVTKDYIEQQHAKNLRRN